jgi:hypothetical protein
MKGPQLRIGRCHVGHYNREMLKQWIPSRHIARITASWWLRLSERNHLVTQVQGRYSHLSVCKSDQFCKTRIDLWRVLNACEAKGAYVELRQPFCVAAN